ncbi:hypothetical protein ACQKJG_18860 [Priestia megaterium]|uniref:hypothetical protein n=1 Tax=Priestia megaterium TaxID=1404 RepID=UPI003D00C14B
MYIMESSYGKGFIHYYAVSTNGDRQACIAISDGKYKNYSIVPVIREMSGEEEGLLFVLNWIVARLKGPLVSNVDSQMLTEYGFEKDGRRLVWIAEVRVVSKDTFSVWVDGGHSIRPVELEIKAKDEQQARRIAKSNFPRAVIGEVKRVEKPIGGVK